MNRFSFINTERDRPCICSHWSKLLELKMCYLYFFCLHCLINIHIFDYPDSRLSGLFTLVPPSPDNRGSTVFSKHSNISNIREKTGSNGEESDVDAGIKNIEEIFTYSWVLTYSYFCFTCRLKKNWRYLDIQHQGDESQRHLFQCR